MENVPDPVIMVLGSAATLLFRFRRGDIPVCQTRILREKHGMPWNKRLAVHPLASGHIEVKALDADEP